MLGTVEGIVEKICKNPKNTNEVHDLLKIFESGNREEILKSSEILFKIFSFHINRGTWKNADQIPGDEEKSKQTKNARIANSTISSWLESSYQAFTKLLLKVYLEDPSDEILQVIIDLTGIEFSGRTQNKITTISIEECINSSLFFNSLVNELLFLQDIEHILNPLNKFFKFVDFNYLFLKSIESWYEGISFQQKVDVNWNNLFKLLFSIAKGSSNDDNTDKGKNYFETIIKSQKVKKILMNEVSEKYKVIFSRVWFILLEQHITPTMRKKILVDLDTKIIPLLDDPMLLIDFLTDSFNKGGVTSILALNGLFILMSNHNLDYPDFYKKLYNLLDPTVFHTKYKSRFFYLMDLFMSSTHLPLYLIEAFVKKLSRMLLFAPAIDQMMLLVFIKNMMIRHPSCIGLIHQKKHKNFESSMNADPYNYEETDPSKCNASQSSLWELETLSSHYLSDVKKCVASFKKTLPTVEFDMTEYFDLTYDGTFKSKMGDWNDNKKPAFEYMKKTQLFEDLDSEMWSLE